MSLVDIIVQAEYIISDVIAQTGYVIDKNQSTYKIYITGHAECHFHR